VSDFRAAGLGLHGKGVVSSFVAQAWLSGMINLEKMHEVLEHFGRGKVLEAQWLLNVEICQRKRWIAKCPKLKGDAFSQRVSAECRTPANASAHSQHSEGPCVITAPSVLIARQCLSLNIATVKKEVIRRNWPTENSLPTSITFTIGSCQPIEVSKPCRVWRLNAEK